MIDLAMKKWWTIMTDENRRIVRRKEKSVKELAEGILDNNRALLAQAITLIESNASKHFEKGQNLINEILPQTGKSVRIGITGVPGAGKSTFIEAFGSYLCDHGHRVAVLAVDPSSSLSGGSILGDKTRMDQLSRNPQAFVRPSPASGTLGGVARKTRETILLCEAAGYDVIIVETVGVGQSEVAVRSMVDVFLLLALTGAGDELQGMKKGIMELVDILIINKADGDNEQKALKAKEEYSKILHFLTPVTKGWESKALTCSALLGKGIEEAWKTIDHFVATTQKVGSFSERRNIQRKDWFYALIKDELETAFFSDEIVKGHLPKLERQVIEGNVPASLGARKIFDLYATQKRRIGHDQSY
ncbi:methylmalonyl Co-A mutase-associated GTPase MeaB [Bacillus salitolerans]|uniref:Methylmalonyl Co-A mutase-associated GTPase MeaB n=1 Tax=Bacillus salitolerans TaxID=1437434 RepID=A0ABW4LNM5_9BACI